MALTADARADAPGPYVSLGPGANWVPYGTLTRGPASSDIASDHRWATIGSVELALTRNWRADVEIAYRRDEARGIGGDLNGSGMSNILLGIDSGSNWKPYIGAGVGTLHYRASGLRGTPDSVGDDDTARAYQGVLGVSRAVTPNARFFLDYRYVYGTDPLVHDSPAAKRTESGSSTVLFGMRFTLAPPPSASNR